MAVTSGAATVTSTATAPTISMKAVMMRLV